MSEQRITKLVKVPLDRPIRDKPASFPPLNDLELNLVENKNLLKDGLPLIPIKEIDATKIKRDEPEDDDEIDIDIGKPHKSKKKHVEKYRKDKHAEKRHKHSAKHTEKRHKHTSEKHAEKHHKRKGHKRHDSLEEALGEDDEQDEPLDESEGDEEDEDVEEMDDEDDEEEDEEEQLTPEEREERDKEEYIWRFRILKKQYPKAEIPEYNEHSNLPTMKKTYERTLRSLSLDSSVETYRTYLVGSFMILEFVSTQWFNINMTGFTKQQMVAMNKYDRLLIELGEKSYNSMGSRLPVEVRLIGFILMQACIFFIGKIIAEKAGEKVADFFAGTAPREPTYETAEQKPKTMRGPSISVDEIRKMNKQPA